MNAWFAQDSNDQRRFTLHADVSFGEERLGGDAATNIVFKVSVKRCDIIFVPPNGAPFRVDPASVRSPRPLDPKRVVMTETTTAKIGGRAQLRATPNSLGASAEAEAAIDRSRTTETSQETDFDVYHEIWKRIKGNHAWTVDGRELSSSRLAGPVFDAKEHPRLTIIDRRPDEAIERDKKQNLEPVATIKVSCLREDIDIYDIQLKDPEAQSLFKRKPNKEIQLMAAREILKTALITEGLHAGDLPSDPFAEMELCDVSVTIVDYST